MMQKVCFCMLKRGLSGCKSMPIGKMKTAIIKNVDYLLTQVDRNMGYR